MIKFFRHIRQQLLSENKTGKYFKYAIGEIVLVVIGILIALQINNWNENRIKNKEVKTFLNNLIQDLNGDQEILNSMNNSQTFKYFSMQYLLEMEGSNPYDPIADRKNDIPPFKTSYYWDKEIPNVYNKEFIQIAFSDTHRAHMPPFSKSTFEELKSTGMYSKLNPELKKGINYYYLFRQNDFHDKVLLLTLDWQKSLAEDGFITTDTYKLPDPLSLIKNNPKRIGLLKRMIRESGWIIQSTINLKKNKEKLIQLIEKEIASI
ncbi:DUF6090 family protein [Algibacter sp.]|uniref:DUF6090 family protein n=1 Tax=Algibacter sp. TaxID=1872428 RepID=UPI003C720A56